MTAHPDPSHAARRGRMVLEVREAQIGNALRDPANLAVLAQWSLQGAACFHVLVDPAETRRSLALALEALLAVLEGACRPEQPLRYTLAGRSAQNASNVAPGTAHAGNWLAAFHLAMLLGEQAAADRLAALPLAPVLESPARPLPYLAAWVCVVHTLIAERRFDRPGIFAALEATEPAWLPQDSIDFVLAVEVPMMNVAWEVSRGAVPAAETALRDALEKHAQHYARPGEDVKPEGFVSWRLSAWRTVARARGTPLNMESPLLCDPLRA